MPLYTLIWHSVIVQHGDLTVFRFQSLDSAVHAKLFSAWWRTVEREETKLFSVRRGFITPIASSICFVS